MTFACLDSLGMGAVLAFFHYYNMRQHKKLFCKVGFWIGLPALTAIHSIPFGNYPALVVIENTITSLFFVWLIDCAANGFSGIIGHGLEQKWLIYMGKISYGIYVYHYFVAPHILAKILSSLNLSLDLIWIQFILKTIVTLMIAALSWEFIEKPINRFKKYFKNYDMAH
jgi:peptidoglycan/LPS O-acetylase OafA/YrhL